MPVGLEARFKRLLKEIVTLSSGIRHSALDYANGQNFSISAGLRRQLETIRTSADTILQAFAEASLTSYSLDEHIDDWLATKEPHLCLEKLREMNDVLRPLDNAGYLAPSLRPAEDKLAVATAFFDDHKSLFHFLLTPDVWNRERLVRSLSEPPQVDAPLATMNVTTTGHENGPQSDADQGTATDRKKELLHQKLDEISRWLAAMECAQKHRDVLRLRQEGTCKWFPNTGIYEKWRAPGNHFLWLHGKGGCGKSVLIASTIEHLKNSLEKEEAVVFFYCDFQNKRSTSSAELMRSLLSQLLYHIRLLGVDPGDFPDKILKQKSEGILSLDDLKKLCDLVSRAASFFRYEPMIVIDALDECADVETLLPVLATLSQSDIRLLVTSRPDQTIIDHFVGLQSLSFEDVTGKVATDIGLHVRRELDSHDRLRSAIPEMKEEVDAKLIDKAEGRFRWAQCQLDTLKRCTTKDELREALDGLPDELGATYERILGAIDERKFEGELARRVLALLMVAIEPLQLVQIIDGLSMDFQKRKHDHETWKWLETKLLRSLSSLVSYDEEMDLLTLSHYSVQEYLTGRSALPMYHIVIHEAHAEAAQICMSYISVFLEQKPSHPDLELWQHFPMLFYVLSFGFNHLAHVDSESRIALEVLQSLGSDVRHHPSHWDRLCELREEILDWPYTPWPSSKHDFVLYVLIAYSPPALLWTFLSGNCPLKPRIKTNPLVYAADLRKTDHAVILLAYSVDVEARYLVIDGSYRASPLEVAIDLGDDVLVEELLRRGCSVTSELVATAVCMPWCSTRVLGKLMQTDEFADWALGIGEEKLFRSVFSSARPNSGESIKSDADHLVLARRLCQLGVDLSAESGFGKGLIDRALHAAHTSMLEFLLLPGQPPPAEFLIAASTGDTPETVPVVRFLLQKGVDVHAVSPHGRDSALHLAAMCPWEPRSLELTGILIDAGCDPYALNSDGETSLSVAVSRGYCSVVEHLLSCHVSLPPNILHVALRRPQNSRMIELLLQRGGDVHAVARYTGNTVLHVAVIGPPPHLHHHKENDHEHQELVCFGLVHRFLAAGCDPTARNSTERTALEMAIQRSFLSVVELLLSTDISLPPEALLIAVQHSTPDMVGYLIQRGTNVRAIMSYRRTALYPALCASLHSEEICCKLIKGLIDTGYDAETRNFTGEMALEVAIHCNFPSVVELLLSSNLPLPPDALLIAVRRSTIDMVEYLVQKGADVRAAMSNGDTAVHLALRTRHYSEETCCKFIKRLINAGCDATARNSAGDTPLEMAIQHDFPSVVELLLSTAVPLPPDALLIAVQHSTLDMIEYLIKIGADMQATTSNRDTVLHLALSAHLYSEGMRCKFIRRFIDAGCDATTRNSTGETALEMAIQRNFPSVVELLLSTDIPLPPDALLIAVQHSTLDMVEYLIQRGAALQVTMSSGDTALHLALSTYQFCEKMCCKFVQRLIDAGCDATARNSAGEAPLEMAIQHHFASVIELLLSAIIPLPPDALLTVVRQGSTLDMIEYLIQRGADVQATTSNEDTALHLTLSTRLYSEEICCKFIKRLMDAGCDASARNSAGEAPLEMAIQRDFPSVVELLLSADIPLPPDALLTAVRQGSTLAIVMNLIQRGSDVHCRTPSGDTVLHVAVVTYRTASHFHQYVRYLINAGCDPSATNSKGDTVLLAAMKRGHFLVVNLLLSLNVPIPPYFLHTALTHHCKPNIIQVLVRKLRDDDHLLPESVSGSNWDTLLQITHMSYSGKSRQRVTKILEAACKACRTRPHSEDETDTDDVKRPRLDEEEQFAY